jgi:hypothetical protein
MWSRKTEPKDIPMAISAGARPDPANLQMQDPPLNCLRLSHKLFQNMNNTITGPNKKQRRKRGIFSHDKQRDGYNARSMAHAVCERRSSGGPWGVCARMSVGTAFTTF